MAKLITEDTLFVAIKNYNATSTATSIGSMSEGMPIRLIGEVVNVDDDMKQCRIKAHIYGITKTSENELSVDDLPWCYANQIMLGMYDAPIVGDYVLLDLTKGIYNATWMHLDSKSEIARTIIGDENAKAKIVIYDDASRYGGEGEFGIFWTPEKGWNIVYNETTISIRKDKSIILQVASEENGVIHITKDGKLSFGTEDASAEPCVLGGKNADMHQKTIDYIKDVVANIGSVMSNLASAAGGNPYTAVLVPGFKSYDSSVKSASDNKHSDAKDFIPKTKSEVSTLD